MIRPFRSLHPFRRFGKDGVNVVPVLDLNLLSEKLDPRITFTRSSTATRFNSSGQLETVEANVFRLDYDPITLAPRGRLVEEARTNSIRNSTMQGAVVGSPGTLPTNWTYNAGTPALSVEVVATGTELGIPYIDVRFFGVVAATAGMTLRFEAANFAAATLGQIWTSSLFAKQVAGSRNGISATSVQVIENTGGGSFVTSSGTAFVFGSTLSRYTHIRTLTGATTSAVQSSFSMGLVAGATVDYTIRFGLPQMEQGAFATSPIPTTNAVVQRTADQAVLTGTNFSDWYNATEGTLFAEATPGADTDFVNVVSAGSSVASGGFMNFRRGSTSNVGYNVIDGTVPQVGLLLVTGAMTPAATYKFAGAYKANDFAACTGGGTVQTDSSGTVPSTFATLLIGNGWNNTTASSAVEYLNGHIRRIAYYNQRLSNADLQLLTA